MTCLRLLTALATGALSLGAVEWATPQGPLEVEDHRQKEKLVILVFGDSGTGKGGQYRVGEAMYQVCRERGCDLALMLGDNIYEDGIKASDQSSPEASRREIRAQFQEKFEGAYEKFGRFDMWAVLGNHDYRQNSVYSQVMYSWESDLWRTPSYYFDVPYLPAWVQIYGVHTYTDEAGIEPAAADYAANGFEDRGGHQTPSASISKKIKGIDRGVNRVPGFLQHQMGTIFSFSRLFPAGIKNSSINT